MKLSGKVLTSMLLMTVVGVGIAGAQSIDATTSTSTTTGANVPAAWTKMHDLKDKISNLSDDVKAQLKAAKQAGDLAKVQSILQANGITMPKMVKRLGKRIQRKANRTARRTDLKNLPDSVKADLKAAFQAKDMAKVKEILAANGIGPKTSTTTSTSTAQ